MYSKVSLASLSNNLNNQLGLLLKLTLLSFSELIFRIQQYFKNKRTSAVLNRHDSLLQKQSDGTETGTTNQHAQESFDQGVSCDNCERILDEISCKLDDKPFYCC